MGTDGIVTISHAIGEVAGSDPSPAARRSSARCPRLRATACLAATLSVGSTIALASDRQRPSASGDAPDSAEAHGVDERVLGLYAAGDGADGTVYVLGCRDEDERAAALDEPCTGDPLFLERLLHVLVHPVQHSVGADALDPCGRASEEEAYRLGGRFLHAHHAEDPLPNRAFRARMARRC